jgi:rhodanese-related sulfurtransferase
MFNLKIDVMKQLFFLFCISVLFFNCERKHYSLEPISQEAFDQLYNSDQKIQLVDVRTQREFDQGAIDGAILIDIRKENFVDQAKSLLNPDKPVYLYCKKGSRSTKAGTELLLTKEFTEVYYLTGGYTEWKQNQENK